MSGLGAGHVRSAGYVRVIGRTCPVKPDLAVSRRFGWICSVNGLTCPVILGQN
jgi:hypothetical protein